MKLTGFGLHSRIVLTTLFSLNVAMVFFCPSTLAQPSQMPPQQMALSLSAAIQMAVTENPGILAAQYQVEASTAQVSQARSGFFPQVNITETFNRTNNPMWAFGTKLNQEIIDQTDFDPIKLNNPDAINNYTTSFSMNWSLFDPAHTWIPWLQSKQNLKTTQLSLERTRQVIINQTVMAYTGLLLAEAHLAVVNKSLETARAHKRMVQSRFENGFIVKSDFLRAQVRVGELEQNLIETESNLGIARAHLNVAMGVPIDRRYHLIDVLEKGSEILGTVESWVEKALKHRPDLEKLRLQEEMAKNEVKKSISNHLPSIQVIGNYEINSEDFEDTAENYTIGAMMHLNLFSGSRLWAKTKEAKASLASVSSLRSAQEASIRVEIRQAFSQAQSAWKRTEVAETAALQADEGLRIVKNRYENGLMTIVGLLDAQVAQQQSQMNYLSALHDYKAATANLALAAGIIDIDFK